MSGGVDSSVAAYLAQREGYECIGCTMKLYTNTDAGISERHTCCSLDDVEDARAVAYRLGMRYCVFNFSEGFRERVIRDGKTLIMTNYGISRGFFIIRPGDVLAGKEELASTLDGVQRYWTHRSLAQLAEEVDTIELLVSGASAITPSGIRFGKGHGYFDLEWAMLYTKGLVDPQTSVVVAAGHDCQVVDVDVTVRPYDTAIDLIVTPTRTIETRNEFPKPTHGVMWYLLEDDMLGRIPPLQELWAAEFCR